MARIRNARRMPILIMFALVFSVLGMTVSAQDAATPTAATPAADEPPPQPSIAFYPAEETPGGYYNAELEPGEQATFSVVLGNSGEVDFDAVTYAADAYSIRNGGFGLEDLDSEQTGPTTWLDYPTEEFSTVAGEGIEREFTVAVPADTAPGEYVTGIAMQTADPVNEEADEGMFRLNQYYRTVIGIRILVPGDLAPAIEFGEPAFIVEGAVPAIVVPITNTGNQQTTPAGEIRVTDQDGNILMSAPVQMGRVYGGHETELWLGLSEPLPNGDYEITVVLDDEDKDLHAELPATVFVVSDSAGQEMAEQAPITISDVAFTPMPDADNIQFAAIDATITNTGDPVTNAQLSLIAKVDGEEVERFPISQSLSLPEGDTDVSTRYLPLTGWTSGEWTFELLVETVEPSGAAVVAASQPVEGTVDIP